MHQLSHTSFAGCVFEDNQCVGGGGAICAPFDALPELTSCQLRRNSASGSTAQGGALYSNAFAGSPVENVVMEVFDCLFQANVANQGGALYLTGSAADILNARFISNRTNDGSDRHGGAVWNRNTKVGDFVYDVDFANCLFLANSAGGRGGAMYTTRDANLVGNCGLGASCVEIYGSTLSQNVAAGKTGGVYGEYTTLKAYNSIFWNNDDSDGATSIMSEQVLGENGSDISVSSSCVQDSLALDGSVPFNASNIDADPLFFDPLGPDLTAFTGDEDLHPAVDPAVSPVADAGNNLSIPNGCLDSVVQPGCDEDPIAIDLDGNPRPANYPGVGPGADTADMGAYEIQCTASAACADAVACTTDYVCTAGGSQGCAHEPVDAACVDSFACTIDTCSVAEGACVNTPAIDYCGDLDVCTFAVCDPTIEPHGMDGCAFPVRGGFGDVTGDGGVDIFDILCVLDGFAGVFTTCGRSNVDLDYNSVPQSCEPDGLIDIFDVLAVLDAFAGIDPCCGGGAKVFLAVSDADIFPNPASDGATWVSVTTGIKSVKAKAETGASYDVPAYRAKVVASDTTLAMVPQSDTIDAGGTVAVDVFADDVKDLRGYQLRLTGTDAGFAASATIIDVYVDTEREDYVFFGADARHAEDMENHRMVVALLDGGVTQTGRVYLGTFVFKADESPQDGIRAAIHSNDGVILVDPSGAVLDVAAPSSAEVALR
ncbi:MAG: hypothetical protein HOP29_14170 [Phycisphaerales bacterium]|nr:hypothetical protein [Phycisphaerales bacterium]